MSHESYCKKASVNSQFVNVQTTCVCVCAMDEASTSKAALSLSPPSSTVSVEQGPGAISGRHRTSLVWEYFEYDPLTNTSVCQILSAPSLDSSSNADVCGHSVPGKFPTNLRQHLKKAHKSEFSDLTRREEKDKREKESQKAVQRATSMKVSQQLTLAESIRPKNAYGKESDRYKLITKKLAIFIGSTNTAYNMVENLEFKDFVHTMDRRYTVPGRAAIRNEIEKVVIELKAKIGSFLQESKKISICADIWSKKGMTSSYLGVTAHFFSRKDHRRHSATLAVRRMPQQHTGENIRELVQSILDEWEIPPSKVSATLTDNGSNMVAAFRPQIIENDDDGEDDMESAEDADLPSLVEEFEEKEEDHEIAFYGLNRVSCFAHTLQLVVQKFDGITEFKSVLKRAHTLVRKFNTSAKATEKLIAKCGKKLVRDCPTRWSSMYLLIERLLAVRSSLTEVLQELEWDDMLTSEWKMLEAIRNFLHPFALFTSLIQGEEYTTISTVIPSVMDLNLHLDEMKRNSEVSAAATKLQSELKKRFRKYTDPSDTNFEHIFLLATSLDPRYRLLLNPVQKSAAKDHLLKEIKNGSGSPQTNSPQHQEAELHQTARGDSDSEPPTKKFRHLNKVLQQKWKEGLQRISKHPPGQVEVTRYFEAVESLADGVDPLEYWKSQNHEYPLISDVAVDILVIPATSAPVERVFSSAGESTTGKRNRLSDKNLEREILLKKNKYFL